MVSCFLELDLCLIPSFSGLAKGACVGKWGDLSQGQQFLNFGLKVNDWWGLSEPNKIHIPSFQLRSGRYNGE